MTRATFLIVAILIATGGLAMAQYAYPPSPYYMNESRASTVGESHARGIADITTAAGQANLNNSEAAINYEQARSMELDNRMKQTTTYFDMRKANQQSRAELHPRMSESERRALAEKVGPQRPNAYQLDPLTGKIDWPLLLTDARYNDNRATLEEMFSSRAETSGFIGNANVAKINHACDDINKAISAHADAWRKANMPDYSAADFVDAQNFMKGLKYEARFAGSQPPPQAVAQQAG
jgi:hypothetical protein